MILVNDTNKIGLNPFININSIEEIYNTPANSTIKISFNIELMQYCQANQLNYATEVSDIKQAIFANILDAKFIIVNKDIAVEIQKIAENYMFDSKVLVSITCEDEISWVAKNFIDGAILK